MSVFFRIGISCISDLPSADFTGHISGRTTSFLALERGVIRETYLKTEEGLTFVAPEKREEIGEEFPGTRRRAMEDS